MICDYLNETFDEMVVIYGTVVHFKIYHVIDCVIEHLIDVFPGELMKVLNKFTFDAGSVVERFLNVHT